MKNKMLGSMAVFGLTLALAGCGGSDSAGSDAGVVTIGVITPTSGALARIGDDWNGGMEVALDHIEEEGGVLGGDIKLKLDVKDEQGGPEGAVQAAREFLADDVQLITGLALSDDCLAVAPFVEQTDAVLVASPCAADGVSGGADGTAPFKNTFAISNRDSITTKGLAEVISDKFPEITDYSLFGLDYSWGQEAARTFQDEMSKNGTKVNYTREYWVPTDATSYRSQISALDRGMADEGEALFLATFSSFTTNFMLQSKAFDTFDKADIAVNSGGYYADARAMDGKASKVWNSYDYHYAAFDSDLNTRFVEEFEAKTGMKPTGWGLAGYNATRALAAAIDEAGSADPSEVRSALEGLAFQSPVGDVVIGATTHQAAVPVAVTLTEGDPKAPEGLKLLDSVVVAPTPAS